MNGPIRILPLSAFVLLASACGGKDAPPGDTFDLAAIPVPAEHQDGQRLFDAGCARCHGPAALGTQAGPPLVHVTYEPGHHGDEAFQRAALQGVRAHHWSFGDMPPVPGATREQVAEIVGYVRWLQRQAGIF